MRELRPLRAFAALLAGLSCLAMPVLASGAWHADPHHGDGEVHAATHETDLQIQRAPAEAGHDTCWTAEVDEHPRHDDRRFETQRGLHHHLHCGVAWSAGSSIVPPGPADHAVLPRVEGAASCDECRSRRALDRSPRQSRAPPRA